MPKIAKLFMNGRSQAVRLPAEFRFEGKEVFIEKQGDAVILRPMPKAFGQWLERFYARHEPFAEDFMAGVRDDPPQDREWFHDENA